MIDRTDVDKVDHAKLLGIIKCHDVTWNKHEENIMETNWDYRCCRG